ncbi:MAG: 5'-nucleotidase, lipoprotein e(P4) family [Chitinophagaceae bacterium]|nr:5'-nucleotidase, lipoprotein e(P4) family [Chitinophagaceae bacterium]MCW5904956.1 5'-nucleotidase, lipoprotein e(P4) family [Chitinophagaceae bacterium]
MRNTIILVALFFIACKTTQQPASNTQPMQPENVSLNGKLFSSLFQQRAAEYRALCYQAYNAARFTISNYKPSSHKPLAIITDIDETLLNNSPYAVHQAYSGKEYDLKSWYEWTNKSSADTMPGAASFLNYCLQQNVHVFYITNRDEVERAATINNLKKFNLPYADDTHLILKQNVSSKEQRRQNVLANYEVILFMGDNLADFNMLFDKKTETERANNVDLLSSEFGKKFIVLPNANYGDWESALYQYKYNYTQAQKDSIMKAVLKGY